MLMLLRMALLTHHGVHPLSRLSLLVLHIALFALPFVCDPSIRCAAVRCSIEWDGLATMQCCPYGPCGDVGSCGTGSGTCAVVSPWQTDEAEDIRGGFGDQFHQNVQVSGNSRELHHLCCPLASYVSLMHMTR